MRPNWGSGLVVLLLASGAGKAAAAALEDIRLWASPESTRVVLDLSEPATYTLFSLSGPERVVIDL
jgi:N-acetylmuramoyl-L-alanine amidase